VAAFLIVTLSSIGLPGLNGFVGEFLILLGAFRADPILAACAATGVILSAAYMLWMFQRVNYGPVTDNRNHDLPDLTVRERWVIVPIVAAAIVMGVAPNLFLRPMAPAVARTLRQVQQGPTRVQAGSQPSRSGATVLPAGESRPVGQTSGAAR
jgi:NADH-quinone oxidoreductase subunit M